MSLPHQPPLRGHPLLVALEEVFDRLPVGLVLLDREGRVLLYNRYEEQLARRRRADVIGRRFFEEVAPCTNVRELAGAFHEHVAAGTLDHALDFEFALSFLPKPREVRITLRSLQLAGQPCAAFMVQDVAELRRSERQREALRTTLVHDLRGDLNGVLGYAQLLGNGGLGPLSPRQERATRTLAEAAQRIEHRVERALSEQPTSERSPVNLHALVLSAINMARPRAEQAGKRLVYEGHGPDRLFPERAEAVAGDVERLGALVDNLVDNALKYARHRVVIALSGVGSYLHLEVRDDGPGIPLESRADVFEPGVRLSRDVPGHGIGLHSALTVVDAHRGRIWIDEAPEGGAALHVQLPRE